MSAMLRLCLAVLFSGPAVLFMSIVSGANTEAADPQPVLKQIASIDLPGVPGKRFDYLVIDYDDGWLFSAHLAANQTYVIDLKSNSVLHTITDTPGAEGLEYAPDERKVHVKCESLYVKCG